MNQNGRWFYKATAEPVRSPGLTAILNDQLMMSKVRGPKPPPPPPPPKEEKTPEEIEANLAKLGLTGIGDAIKGLHELFGGGTHMGAFGPTFDEKTYARAKPYFQSAWEKAKKIGQSIVDFVKALAQELGQAIKPYLKKFMQEVRAEDEESPPPPAPKPNEFQVEYVTKSKGTPFGTLVPRNISEGVQNALTAIETRHGPIDEYVAGNLNMEVPELHQIMAADQIDGVALAIDQIERGGALIIGDETGIGKGRQGAAIIRYAILNGKIPLFFTKDPKLFSDMYGDLKDIHTKVAPLIFGDTGKATIVDPVTGDKLVRSPSKKIQDREMARVIELGMEGAGYNAILSTYSQINDQNNRQDFIQRLCQQKDVIVVMDEAHEAAGDAKSSMQAAFFSGGQVQRKVHNHTVQIPMAGILNMPGTKQGRGGVLYMSATYAKRPENMPVYFRTSLSKAAQNLTQIVDAMKRGGVALQQAVSEALAKDGQYIRRERDFSGVRYDMKTVEVKDVEALKEEVDSITDVLGQIVDFSGQMIAAVQGATAMSGTAHDMTDFASIVHNQIGQLLLAAKAESVIKEAIEAKARGEKPVIALMNTMESFLGDFVADKRIAPGMPIKLRWNELTKYALSRTLRRSTTNPDGTKTIDIVNPDEFGLGALYRSIEAASDAIESKFPVSPIDYIIQKLNAAGCKMCELTGRESGIDYTNIDAGEGFYKRFKKANKNQVVNGFNNAVYDGMLMNASGSTGLSAHASKKTGTDHRPRRMIIAQAALDINVFVQTLGRIKRTGMIMLGKGEDGQPYGCAYTHLVLPLQAELRPAAKAAKKMKSLNANTTAEADNAIKIEAEDIFNRYGDRVVAEYLDTHPEFQGRLELPIDVNDDGSIEVPRDVASRFMGRMALLPDFEQKQAYDQILPAYRELIQQLKATGEYDLEIVVHKDWDGHRTSDEQLAAGTDESSIFTAGTRLQHWDVKDTRHTPTGAEMLKEFHHKLGDREKLTETWQKVQDAGDKKLSDLQERIDQEQAAWQADEDNLDKLTEKERTAHDIAGMRLAQMTAQLSMMTRRWENAKDLADHMVGMAGRVVEVANDETGDVFDGMLVDIKFPTARYSPSALRFKFMLHSPGGVAYINGAQFGAGQWRVDTSDKEVADLRGGNLGARYERYLVTGNPIRAYVATGGRGKMTRFTSDQGEIITGLLMPRNWGPAQLANDPRLDLVNGVAAVHFLTNYGMDGRTSVPIEAANIVRITRNGWGSRSYTISTSKARATGGRIYLDEQLKQVTGDFTMRGNRYVVDIDEGQLQPVVERIMQIASQQFRPVGNAATLMPQVLESNRRGTRQGSLSFEDKPGMQVNVGGQSATLVPPGGRPPGTQALPAFHGTPHEVDKFSTQKIGTGEGAQAYGWGLYFAEEPKVAEYYADNIPNARAYDVVNNALWRAEWSETVDQRLADNGISVRDANYHDWLSTLESVRNDYPDLDDFSDALDKGIEDLKNLKGNVYTVDISATPDTLLDWDKPLNQQPEKVRTVIVRSGILPLLQRSASAQGTFPADMDGQAIYEIIASAHAAPMESGARVASRMLSDLGIPGIQFMDQLSRDNPSRKPTYNYVIWDESKIKITHENGEPVTPEEFRQAMIGQASKTALSRGPVKARSVPELRAAVNAPDSGLSKDAVKLINAFLDSPLGEMLEGVSFQISDALDNGWQGSYFKRLAEWARSASPEAGVHELLHAIWEVLPKELQDEFERLRTETLSDLIKEAESAGNAVRAATLSHLLDNPTTGGDEFLGRRYPSAMQRELYPLSSAEEYFTNSGSQEFKKKVGSTVDGFWARVKAIISRFIEALKRAFKPKASRDKLFNQVLKGDFKPTLRQAVEAERGRQASIPPTPPEGEKPSEVIPPDTGQTTPSIAEQQADADVARELADDEGEITRVMGRKDIVRGGVSRMGPAEQAAGTAHAAAIFAKAGLQVELQPDGFWKMSDEFTQQEVEGQRLLTLVSDELARQGSTKGADTGYLGNLINSVRIHISADDNQALSEALKDELYSVTVDESSHRGAALKALDGFKADVEYTARHVDVMLRRIYSDEFGGPFVRKVVKDIATNFRDYFTPEEIETALKNHPQLQDVLDLANRLNRQEEGGAVYRRVQSLLKPKQAKKLSRLEADARIKEAVNEILQQAKAQGIEPVPRPGKPLSPLRQLIHMVNPKTQAKIQGLMEQAIADAERNAGIKAALKSAGSDVERQDMEGRFGAGEEPTHEQIEAGLNTPEFSHWREIRDNLLGYDPVTIKLVEQLLRSDFRGTKFSPPAEKVVDTRLDLEKLAKQPDAEVARVVDAYLDNLDKSMDIGSATPETKARIQEMVEAKVASQVEAARARVREPLFKPPTAKGAVLTPEQRIGQLINAKLFADPRLNIPEMVARVAAKSAMRRLTPKLADLVTRALQTPFYRQSDIAENFANLLIEHLGITPDQADQAKAVFVKAMEAPMAKAREQAQKRAVASVTPRDRSLMNPRKALWKKLVENANAGNFDSGDILRQIAQAHGWHWTDTSVAKMRDLADRLQRLNELTPAEVAQAGGDPKALIDSLVDKQAVNRERSMDLRRQMSTLWSRLTKPLTYKTVEGRENIARAVREFVCAKMLYKVSHPFRMLIEIVSQGSMHTPTRAAAAAWGRWSNDRSAGRNANLLMDLITALKDAYAVRINTTRATWTAFKQGLAGSPEARNVDMLMSKIAAFERMAQVADEKAAAGGNHGQRLVLWLMRHVELSYRIMQALDNLQGVPAEYQELRQRVVSELRLNGATRAEAFAKADGVMGDFKAEWNLAYARAAEIFDIDGREKTKAQLDAAARDLVWARTLQRIRAIGLPADAFAEQAENVRAAVSWSLKAGGPGGALARGMEAVNQALGRAYIPIPLFPFSNAIATGINRTLTWSGGGFFPGAFKDDPFFASDEDRRQRKIEAAAGCGIQMILFMAILAGLAAWTGSGPKDPRERELWHKQGHRENTLEIPHADGTFHAISGILGWLMPLRPAMAMAGAIVDLQKERAKAQQKMDDEALKLGLTPGKIRPINAADWMAVAISTAFTSLIGGRTAIGMTGSVTQEGQLNAAKAISSVLTRAVPLPLEGYQELTRMAGIQMDSKLAGVLDFMLPTGASGARKLNMLGDPVGTEDAVQRVVQIITLGTYPFAIDPKKAAEAVPYAALFNSGYRPPEISPSEGYAIGSEYRPMTNEELARYAKLRGDLLKQELTGAGPNADRKEAIAAFQAANQQALERMGVDTGAKREAAAAATEPPALPPTPAAKFVPPGAPTAARVSGGGAVPRSSGVRSLRGMRTPGLSRAPGAIRGPSLRRGARMPQRGLSVRTGIPSVRSLRPRRS